MHYVRGVKITYTYGPNPNCRASHGPGFAHKVPSEAGSGPGSGARLNATVAAPIAGSVARNLAVGNTMPPHTSSSGSQVKPLYYISSFSRFFIFLWGLILIKMKIFTQLHELLHPLLHSHSPKKFKSSSVLCKYI